MEQFTVPQFIDVEDKIIGPISVRQFLTMLVAAGLVFADYEIIYLLLYPSIWFFILSSLFIVALCGSFAFVKVNGRPFHHFLLNVIVTLQKPRLRVWNKRVSRSEVNVKEEEIEIAPAIPVKTPLSKSKLTELSLVVDTGGAYQEELPTEEEEARAKEAGEKERPKDIFE